MDVDEAGPNTREKQSSDHFERLKPKHGESVSNQLTNFEEEKRKSEVGNEDKKNFIGGPSNWDPDSKGVDSDILKASLASQGIGTPNKKQKEFRNEEKPNEAKLEKPVEDIKKASSPIESVQNDLQNNGEKTLMDAVKPKHKRKKKQHPVA